MLHCYVDASYDPPVLGCGYIITETSRGDERLVNAGCKILHTEAVLPHVDWCSMRAEYRAVISGVRAALPHATNPLMLYSDNDHIVDAIRTREWFGEPYFDHALFSFLGRFEDWHVTNIDRERNDLAHEQARIGLKLGRDIVRGFES